MMNKTANKSEARADFLKIIDGFNSVDIRKQPGFIVMKRLYEALCEEFLQSDARRIVTSIKIDVDQHFIDDEELVKYTIDTYVKAIVNMRAAFDEVDAHLFFDIVDKMGMSLTYKEN